MNSSAGAGRVLARLIHQLESDKDRDVIGAVRQVDLVFLRFPDRAHIMHVLRKLPASLDARHHAVAVQLREWALGVPDIELNRYQELAWEYRDERLALKEAVLHV